MAPLRNSCESRSGTPISQTVAAVRGGVMVTVPRLCVCPAVTVILPVGFVNWVKMLELGMFPVAVVKVPAAPRPNAQRAYVPGMTWGMLEGSITAGLDPVLVGEELGLGIETVVGSQADPHVPGEALGAPVSAMVSVPVTVLRPLSCT